MAVATLLPNGEQTFVDPNGVPYAGGSVYFYIPSTTTPKTTWQDAQEMTPNTNPVVLDGAGRAVIYGSGQYRQVLFDSLGNEVWDKLTQDVYSLISQGQAIWGGTATGSANALVLTSTPLLLALVSGQLIGFIASGAANTGPTTVNVSSLGVIDIKAMSSSGLIDLVANNIVAGGRYLMIYDGSDFVLLNPTTPALSNAFQNIASATTTDLGSIGSTNIKVTGTSTITSFGSSAAITNPLYNVIFTGSLIITEGANITTPNGANIVTQAGDYAILQYNGTGSWTVLGWFPSSTGYIGSINLQIFTNSGTYFPTANLVYAEVEMVAAGGNGGNVSGSTSGGGGAGGYVTALLTAAQAGGSQTITIGTTGSPTSLGSLMSCNSGATSVAGSGAGALGGAASISTGVGIATTGGTGGTRFSSETSGGQGASSPLGAGGTAGSPSAVVNGGDATGYGAGGGGTANSGAANGGAGSPGIIMIKEYLYK